MSDAFSAQNGLNLGDNLSLLLFNFTLEYAIRMVQENHERLELNGIHSFHPDYVNLLGKKHK
jgi:hypothetical protein